jgi:glycosyltransferase involved in cell wall biosynthesis
MSTSVVSPGVLIAHPGTQYAPHLAAELEARGLLGRFWTGFAISAQSWMDQMLQRLPARFRKSLERRRVAVPAARLRTRPWLDWHARRAARHAGEEAAFFERNRRFQEAIPETELRAAGVVVGFDTSSWLLAMRARKHGKRFILDQSIGHPAAKERAYAGIRRAYPAWNTSIPHKAEALVAAEREEHSLAHVIVVPSRFVRRTLVEEGVDAAKVRVIPFGTDIKLFQPVAQKSHAPGSKVVFLFVGGVTARKGVPVLLDAWRRWNPDDAELWIAGPGAIPDVELDHIPSSVKLLGAQGRPEVAALMQQADVFVFPSFFEGLAQVQIEAQATGLPLIGTEESGAEELVEDGRTGSVVPAGDVAALEAAMRRLAADPALRQKMRQHAIAGRERLSWQHYGDQWARLVAEVADLAPGSASPATE